MKIIRIFKNSLFSFQYNNEKENEYDRLMELWNDTLYLHNFFKANKQDLPKGNSTDNLTSQIIENANRIDDLLLNAVEKSNFEMFFRSLHNQEYQSKILSKRKGRKVTYELYALKVDTNCYVITGGAIKFTQLMEDRPHTKQELVKLEKCRNYLKENGVMDIDSFYEFLEE